MELAVHELELRQQEGRAVWDQDRGRLEVVGFGKVESVGIQEVVGYCSMDCPVQVGKAMEPLDNHPDHWWCKVVDFVRR